MKRPQQTQIGKQKCDGDQNFVPISVNNLFICHVADRS